MRSRSSSRVGLARRRRTERACPDDVRVGLANGRNAMGRVLGTVCPSFRIVVSIETIYLVLCPCRAWFFIDGCLFVYGWCESLCIRMNQTSQGARGGVRCHMVDGANAHPRLRVRVLVFLCSVRMTSNAFAGEDDPTGDLHLARVVGFHSTPEMPRARRQLLAEHERIRIRVAPSR